jgi:putative hydrolase of the HAD superfamily
MALHQCCTVETNDTRFIILCRHLGDYSYYGKLDQILDRMDNKSATQLQKSKKLIVTSYPDLLALPEPPTSTVIFLDAVGTIIGVKDGVGEIYSEFAHKFGVECDPAQVNAAFYQEFKTADPCVFPGATSAEIPAKEYQWWRKINQRTFTRLDKIADFSDFEGFFAELYCYFATAAAWEVYPDTLVALDRWQKQGFTLGIVSNFDTRLYSVLDALDLRKYFSSVTISTEAGAAKPSTAIFQQALSQHNYSANNAWHIGDSETEDYQGATAAGLKAWLLQRD